MASVAWGAMFKINRDDRQIAERINAFDRPQRRAAQRQVPGPVYEQVIVRGQTPSLAAYANMTQPYPWPPVATVDRKQIADPIVGYVGHRSRKREVFSQSTFMPINQKASTVTDSWQTTAAANWTGHKGEVARLALARSQNLTDKFETMRTVSAAAALDQTGLGPFR